MPSALVVPRIHRAPEAPFDFEADDVRVEERAARGISKFSSRESRSHERCARMRERHETHVVEIQRVCRGAIREGGGIGAGTRVRAKHSARSACAWRDDALHDAGGRFANTSKRDTDSI